MNKYSFILIFLFSYSSFISGAEPGTDWWGQNGSWSSDGTTNSLVCDATTNFGGANNWIATTFGTAGPWKDMTLKFDFFMPNSPNALTMQFGQSANDWANGGIKVQFNIYGVFAYNPSWGGQVLLLDANFGTGVYKYKTDGWNTAVVKISSNGVVSVKLNGVNGPTTFTPADAAVLDGQFCSVNYQYSAGNNFQIRNVEFTKGTDSKKYFTCTPAAYTNMNMFASTNAWFPVNVIEAVGPDNATGGWYTVTTPGMEQLKFDGTIVPGQTGVRTEKAAQTDEWWSTKIKFKTGIDASGATTTIKIGSNGVWNTRANGGRCIMLNINKFEVRMLLDHQYGDPEDIQLWAWNSPTVYEPYNGTGPFEFEIAVSDALTHAISLKINGVSAPVTYNVSGLGLNRLNANGPLYFEVYPGVSPFDFSNVLIKKAGIAKTVFPTINYMISATANNSTLGLVTGGGVYSKSSDVTLVATPTAGNVFVNWTEDGLQVSADATMILSDISSTRNLVANFETAMTTDLNIDTTSTFSIYPLNNNGLFGINTELKGANYVIINATGQKIKHGKISNTTTLLDLSGYQKGACLIMLYGDFGQITKKILIN